MPRVPYLSGDAIPAEAGPSAAHIEATWGRLPRPLQVLLHSPIVATRVSDLMQAIQQVTGLSAAYRELAILAVCREVDCQFEWTYHERSAAARGVPAAAVAAIKQRAWDALGPQERPIVDYARQVLTNSVSAQAWAAVEQRLGPRGACELTATVGFYAMLCMLNNAVAIDLPAGIEPLLS
jgi:alkylhydroperoxidase family enzyme